MPTDVSAKQLNRVLRAARGRTVPIPKLLTFFKLNVDNLDHWAIIIWAGAKLASFGKVESHVLDFPDRIGYAAIMKEKP